MRQGGVGLDALTQLLAVEFWHVHVNHHTMNRSAVGHRLVQRGHGLAGVGAGRVVAAPGLEQHVHQVAVGGVVVHHQNVFALQSGQLERCRGIGLGGWCRSQAHGQFKPEQRTLARFAADTNGAAHELDQPLADGQPQARATEIAADGTVGLGERCEQFGQFVGRDAHAAVANFEAQQHGVARLHHTDRHRDLAF